MATHEQSHISPTEVLQGELSPPQSGELETEAPVFEYEADHLPSLSAEQMDEIETRAWEEADNGVPAREVQAHVYEALTDLGFDVSSAQGDCLPVRFVGIDGKEDVRAIVVDYRDFGTRVKAATLQETASLAPKSNAENRVDEEIEPDDPEQQAVADSLMAHLNHEVARLDLSSEDDRRLRENIWQNATHVLQDVRTVARNIGEGGRPDSIKLRQLEDTIMNEIVRTLNVRASQTESARIRVSRLEDMFAEVASEASRKLDAAHAEVLQARIRRANSVRVELGANRTQEDAATHRAAGICGLIGRVISEMATSRYGYESFDAQLRQLSAELEQEIARHGASESQLRRLSTDLQDALSAG